MGSPDLTLATSVDAFFHEVVTDALSAVDLEVSESAGWYLVGLLSDHTRTRLTDEPLGVKLVEASKDPGERVRTLKHVGDTSLYVAGFFAESLTRSLVDVDYYVGIGQSAYSQLARHFHSGKSLAMIYEELADQFPKFVDVLVQVRKRIDFATPDVGRLYEMWLRTRDEWCEKKLRDAGIIVELGTKVVH